MAKNVHECFVKQCRHSRTRGNTVITTSFISRSVSMTNVKYCFSTS